MQDLLVQTYSGKVVAFTEEEGGVYQGSRSTPISPLRRLTSQFSKVGPPLLVVVSVSESWLPA